MSKLSYTVVKHLGQDLSELGFKTKQSAYRAFASNLYMTRFWRLLNANAGEEFKDQLGIAPPFANDVPRGAQLTKESQNKNPSCWEYVDSLTLVPTMSWVPAEPPGAGICLLQTPWLWLEGTILVSWYKDYKDSEINHGGALVLRDQHLVAFSYWEDIFIKINSP